MKQVKFAIPVRMLAFLCGLLLTATAYAQEITVNGHVKDAMGEPVIGATISVGGKGVAITDFDGNFTLKAEKGATLTATFVGFTNATVAAAPQVVITMNDDSKMLEQVVVIGYGRAKKDDLTGSVSAMKPDELSKGITNNATDMLVGKVAGVDVQTDGGAPGAGAQVRIRGGASMSASNDPLYVIDGLQIDNNNSTGKSNILAMINPNDIESFTVLKSASAAAIYGSRGSNGVIIITTKKGRAGSAPSFTYNADVTVSTVQKKYDVLNAAEYKSLVASLGLDASKLGNADTNWQDEIYRTTASIHQGLSMSGGLKNMPYRASIGYDVDNGIIKTSWMRRFNAALNLAPRFLNDHLTFNISLKYMYEKDRYTSYGDAVNAALEMDPTRPVRDYSSDYFYMGYYYQNLMDSSSPMNSNWKYTSNNNATQNPVALLENQHMYAHTNDFSGNIEMDYKIHGLEDLHLHASLGAQYTMARQTNEISPFSYGSNYYGWNGIQRNWKYNIAGNVYLQYAHTFGAHDIDVMAGAEQQHYHRSGFNEIGNGTDFYTGEIYADGQTKRTDSGIEWRTHNSLVSYFGRLNYGLLDRYLITATFRADGSSRFADGHKWGYFPSAAFAWKINKEKFLSNVSWLDELKLRVDWGITGQQNGIDDFYYMALYTGSNQHAMYPFGDTYHNTVRPGDYNPTLTWEKTTTWNVGLDFSALNGRFTANVDAYFRKTRDLLSWVSNQAFTNFGDQSLQNIGSLENYGVELTFGIKPIVTKNFTWDVTYNVGYNHNEITSLNANGQDYVWVTSTSVSGGLNTRIQRNKVGEPVNSFFVYQQVYDENGKPIEGLYVDRDGNGTIDDGDRYYYKSPAAPVFMGLTSKFLYKNWDLSIALRAAFDNYVFYDFLSSKASVSQSGLYYNSAFRNTSAEAVALGFTGTTVNKFYCSDYFVRNASYLKCSNITLGYTFPALLEYAGHKYFSGRVFGTVQNPFIISKYKGLDPEVANGVDKGRYPRPISVQLGVNFNF